MYRNGKIVLEPLVVPEKNSSESQEAPKTVRQDGSQGAVFTGQRQLPASEPYTSVESETSSDEGLAELRNIENLDKELDAGNSEEPAEEKLESALRLSAEKHQRSRKRPNSAISRPTAVIELNSND